MRRMWTRFRLRLRSLVQRRRVEEELDEEMRYHLDREIEEGIRCELSREEARYAALRTLGAITQNKEECRRMRAWDWMENGLQDLRYGARTLWQNPAFSIVAVLALALGIGANTAMFSVAYGLLMRPLPYADADRVAIVSMSHAKRENAYGTMCVRDFLLWKDNNRAFEEPMLLRSMRMDIGGAGRVPEQIQGASVSAGFFSMLGVPPLMGRTFVAGEDNPGTGSLVVLSEAMWRRRFGASRGVLGQTIEVNGSAATVVGVMPDAFKLPRRETEVWTNLVVLPPTRYGPWFYRGIARLKRGVTYEQAQAELNTIGLRMEQQNPYYRSVKLPALSLRDTLVGTTLKPAILVLMGAVGLVLLIAVVNVANLMLARGTSRRREMALRLSLGAGRWRLVRQLLTESVLLAVIGGMAGMALAWGAVKLIRVWNPGNLPLIDSVRLDWTALLFMAGVSVVTGVLFGLAPALGSARADLNSTLKESGRTGSASQALGRARSTLVVSEVALSLLLLVGAGLLLRSFMNLQRMTGGFATPPQQILTMLISPGDRRYSDENSRRAFYDEVLRQASAVQGVEMAAVSDSLPPDRQGDADTFAVEGRVLAPGEMNPVVGVAAVSPQFLPALRIPLVRGRNFNDHDGATATQVAIVSEGFARRFFPNEEAIGKRINVRGPWMEVVGVVGNVKYLGLTVDTDSAIYMPASQAYRQRMYLVVRSSGDAASLGETLRRAIQSIDAGVTLAQIGTMEQALDASVSRPRFNTMLLGLFAGIAVLLATVGIYGLVSYWVAQRTQEIGVRVALGAAPMDVMRTVVRQGAALASIGIVIGLSGALVVTRLMRTMVFGVDVIDAVTFTVAPLAILLVVLLATFVPALRATRISPVVALRYE